MSDQNQYRMRWDCLESGCFNYHKRPRFDAFASAFPGTWNFSDVDGLIEVGGNGLLLEWKEHPRPLPTGQLLAYTHLSVERIITVFLVAGDVRTMTVKAFAYVLGGTYVPWTPHDLSYVNKQIRRWVQWATAHKRDVKPVLQVM